MELTVSKEFIITDLTWERVFLHITVEGTLLSHMEFYFHRYNRRGDTKEITFFETLPVTYKTLEDNKAEFVFNIPAMNGRTFMDNGNWLLQGRDTVTGTEYTAICSIDMAKELENRCRIFRYAGGKLSYDMSFDTFSEDDFHMVFALHSHFMIENKHWKRRQFVAEVDDIPRKIKRFFKASLRWLVNAVYQVLAFCHHNTGKNIMFMSETRGSLWGNLKSINDRVLERELDKEFHLTYSTRKAVGQNAGFFSWIRVIAQIAKQDVIFVDDYTPIFGHIKLQKNTKLVQVWHAGEGFKAVGYCRFGKAGTPFPVETCHKEYDKVIVGSEHLVHTYEEVFGIERDAFLPIGMARLDGFLDEDRINAFKEEFYDKYPNLKGKKLILFAPTFRGAEQKLAYYDYDKLDYEQLYEFCGDEWVWAFKMHPFVKQGPNVPEKFKDRLIDLSDWMNINDLYYVTELLITDYSSNYYEYALMEKPCLFFTYDRDLYEVIRGVHKSVKDTAPGKVVDTFEDMMKALYAKDFEEEKIHKFVKDNFADYDGHAADRIIDQVLLGKNS